MGRCEGGWEGSKKREGEGGGRGGQARDGGKGKVGEEGEEEIRTGTV